MLPMTTWPMDRQKIEEDMLSKIPMMWLKKKDTRQMPMIIGHIGPKRVRWSDQETLKTAIVAEWNTGQTFHDVE